MALPSDRSTARVLVQARAENEEENEPTPLPVKLLGVMVGLGILAVLIGSVIGSVSPVPTVSETTSASATDLLIKVDLVGPPYWRGTVENTSGRTLRYVTFTLNITPKDNPLHIVHSTGVLPEGMYLSEDIAPGQIGSWLIHFDYSWNPGLSPTIKCPKSLTCRVYDVERQQWWGKSR
jgi:hypothetical protein